MTPTETAAASDAKSRKLLFLLPFAPDLQGTHGGAQACAAIIAMLASHHRVRVLYLAPDGAAPPRQLPAGCEGIEGITIAARSGARRGPLRRMFATLASAWRRPGWVEEAYSPAVRKRIAEVAKAFEPEIVHFEFHVMAQYARTIRSASPGAKCVVTEHEPGVVAGVRRGTNNSLRRHIGNAFRRNAWARYERKALRMADAVIVFTQSDADVIRSLIGRARPPVRIIPLRLPLSDPLTRKPKGSVHSDFLFVGNFMHPPNADAARRLVQTIFPLILRERPEATLTVVGPNPPQDLLATASESVTLTGWVDDPSAYLAGASVVLVPLRQGGGMRVKMLEACAAAKAIVASPTAVEGLSLRHDRDVLIAETDRQFASSAVKLISDPPAQARLERASRRWWEEDHDVDRWAAEYADLYESLDRADPEGEG